MRTGLRARAPEVVYVPFAPEHELAEAAAHVYGRAFSGPPYYSDPIRMEFQYLQNLRERHYRKPGLVTMNAVDHGQVVGTGYGYHLPGQDWWGEIVAGALEPAETRDRWLGDAFTITELAVLPGRQGQGIGHGLLDAMLEGRTERTAVLSTRRDASAHHLYRSAGFEVIAELKFPTNPARYFIMGRDLAGTDS